MRAAFLFGPVSVGARPIDFEHIETSPRGLTGTDNSFLGYARGMAERDHDVTIFASRHRWRTTCDNIAVRPYEERRVVDSTWDAAIAWNDIAGLSDVSPNGPRVLNVQLNDFSYTTPEQHECVDLYLAPSAALARRLECEYGAGKWQVAPNGCDPAAYTLDAKIVGRCIYASSPDRGLHLVVEQWPAIRSRVPHATLRIFYHSLEKWFDEIDGNEKSPYWTNREHARRAKIVRELLPRLESHGVEVIGGVSRERMAAEYSAAQCLVGPTDTVGYTEGFAVAALEGCASGAIPCITTIDALGEVYRGACPMLSVPEGCHRFLNHPELVKAWTDNVVRSLTDGAWRDEWVGKGRAFAERHAWPVLAERLETTIEKARVTT